jgi:molybdate ABC transporter permease protein
MPTDFSPLWISLKTAALATLVTFFLGIAAAYWMLGYRGRGRSLLEGLFIAPLVLPPTVLGFFLLLLFGKHGPLGQLLSRFNISIVFTWYAAVITASVVAFPLMYKTTLAAFQQIDINLLQVARTLGASEQRVFWQVIIPLALPGLLAGVTLAFARALGEFGATLMLAGNIPGQTQTLPMAIYFAVEAGAMSEAWFWVAVISSIALAGIILANRWQSRPAPKSQQPNPHGTDPAPPPSPAAWAPPQGTQRSEPASELVVDLHKPLADFDLKVAFQAQAGTLGILGASGAGKSMILRCIAGVETPQHGRIVLNRQVLLDTDARINLPSGRRHVGLLFQNYALFPHLTVAENIAFGLHHYSRPERQRKVNQQLQRLMLEGLGDRHPRQLSGGQQQRVALARALVTEPEALLLDEPFSALDTHLRSQLERQLIDTLSTYSGISLFVTHNLEEAYRVCSELIVIAGGQAIARGSKPLIFANPGNLTAAQLTGCKNFSRAQTNGLVSSPGAIASGSIRAVDWNCDLQIQSEIPDGLAWVGIRAHHVSFTDQTPRHNNHFPCWLAQASETPFRMTLYLKLHLRPTDAGDYDLQAELFKERWDWLKALPQPWTLVLNPERLMLLTESSSSTQAQDTLQ